jgi:hypothetical protein
VYPTSARQQHIQGTVAVDAEIGLDDVPRMKKVVANPDPSLVRSAVDHVTHKHEIYLTVTSIRDSPVFILSVICITDDTPVLWMVGVRSFIKGKPRGRHD